MGAADDSSTTYLAGPDRVSQHCGEKKAQFTLFFLSIPCAFVFLFIIHFVLVFSPKFLKKGEEDYWFEVDLMKRNVHSP